MRHLSERDPTMQLAELTPSRWDDRPVERMTAALTALTGRGGLALEVAWVAGEVRFLLRATGAEPLRVARAHLRAVHPQLRETRFDIRSAPASDPLWRAPGERQAVAALRLTRPAAYPLRTATRPAAFGGGGRPARATPPPTEPGDSLAGLLLAATTVTGAGQRVVLQLVLAPAPARWAARLAARLTADRPTAPRPRPPAGGGGDGLLPLVAALGLGGLGLRGYLWVQQGDLLPAALLGGGAVGGLALTAAVAARFLGQSPPPPDLVREKLATPVFSVRVRVIALGTGSEDDLAAVAARVAAAAVVFDHPLGNALRPRRGRGDPRDLTAPSRWWPAREWDLLSAAEIAALWHLPAGVAMPLVTAARSRVLAPPLQGFTRGARVGVTGHEGGRDELGGMGSNGAGRAVHLPPHLLGRHHLVVARTRRGKSTLLTHLARAVLERLAAGEQRLALVLIDPHQDLAEAVLGLVPAAAADRVAYLNLADRDHPIGLNLLDPDLFPDRDRTAEHLVAMLHRLWPDNWGPRMEGALRAALMALHEANTTLPPSHRSTLLDVTPFLTLRDVREDVLRRVADPALHAWWHDTFTALPRVLQQQIATPVTTKIGRFLVGEAGRMVLGQPRSTINPRQVLAGGGALIVNAAAGRLGEGGAALLGATVLNLVGLLAEEQVALPVARRTRVVALVDEASTLAAADYPRMLSEFGKYGLAVTLVTQSLAKLDAIDRSLRPTVLANIDALTTFAVSAEDARLLAPELGPELAVEDLTDLPDFTCYARWWDGHGRPPAFSFRLDPPPATEPGRAAAIIARSAARFGRPRAAVLAELAERLTHRETGWTELPDAALAEGFPDSTGAGGEGAEGGASPDDALTPTQATLWAEPGLPDGAKPTKGGRRHARGTTPRRNKGA